MLWIRAIKKFRISSINSFSILLSQLLMLIPDAHKDLESISGVGYA